MLLTLVLTEFTHHILFDPQSHNVQHYDDERRNANKRVLFRGIMSF